jgi:hypothetical protein
MGRGLSLVMSVVMFVMFLVKKKGNFLAKQENFSYLCRCIINKDSIN